MANNAFTKKEIIEKIRLEEEKFSHSENTKEAKLCLVRANQWRKKIKVAPRKYIALQSDWKLEHGIPNDLEVYEDDVMHEMASAEKMAQNSELIKSQTPVPSKPLSKEDGIKAGAMIKIADTIRANPGIKELKGYKKAITEKAGVERKYVDLFFKPNSEIIADPIAQALNWETMGNSEIYTNLRKKDIELLDKAQNEIKKAIETGYYNGKRVSLPQILEASKVLGARIKQYDASSSHKPKLDNLPVKAILLLAKHVESTSHQISQPPTELEVVDITPDEDED